MEVFELAYFIAVAKHENMQPAASEIAVSPSSLSKAVKRLEDELSTKLFRREGRRVRLGESGRELQRSCD